MRLIKRIADNAWKSDVLKDGFKSLNDVLSENSEETVKEAFFSVLKKEFPAKTFVEATLKQGAATKNEADKDLLMGKLPKYIEDTAHKYYQKFYRKCLIDDEVTCEPKELIFKQAVEKFAGEIATDSDISNAIEEALASEDIKKKYFTHEEKKPKENDEKDDGKLSDEEKIKQYFKRRKNVPFDKLREMNEPVGTKHIPIVPIDVGRRDYPFIVMENSIFVKGTHSESHSEALARYAEEHKDELGKKLKEAYKHRSSKWYRDNAFKVFAEIGMTHFAFGHVREHMAFIDTCEGSTPEEVKDVVVKQSGIDKVYDVTNYTSFHDWDGIRLARLIPNYNRELHKSAIEALNNLKK